ncbi:MAG: aminotransferase class I/II-fold pyridoxal phosphate-dependent enzyme [Pseudomonadota bacterium]
MTEVFTGSFTQQLPIPEDAIDAAVEVMRTGRLHRYNLAPGETGAVGALEQAFAAKTGAQFCLAVASGGQAMAISLRAAGVTPGDTVLTNAFTLAPVPGAIAAVGARPVFVETTEALTIDLDDLAAKAGQARVLLLSHMRGHICDMDRLMAICEAAGVTVIEDCAHTMGASWRGTPSGRHGLAGCYSTQTYKHMNSGEGGLIVSDNPEFIARATLLSGSYMLFERHPAGPGPEVYADLTGATPNMSARMDHLRAALLLPQLARLEKDCAAWNERYRVLEAGLASAPGVTLIPRPAEEAFVGSSFQFHLTDWPAHAIRSYLERCAARGVELKWFGASAPQGFTSTYAHWRFADPPALTRTDQVLAGLIDMRLPLTFDLEDCALIARILRSETEIHAARPDSAA